TAETQNNLVSNGCPSSSRVGFYHAPQKSATKLNQFPPSRSPPWRGRGGCRKSLRPQMVARHHRVHMGHAPQQNLDTLSPVVVGRVPRRGAPLHIVGQAERLPPFPL